MPRDASDQKLVMGWLDDLGVTYRDGGVNGPTLVWGVSMAFGSSTHVSIAYDAKHPRRLEILSDVSIADDHQSAYVALPKAERDRVDARVAHVLLRRSSIMFQLERTEKGAPGKIAMRVFLPLEGLTPHILATAVFDARNTTKELCLAWQEMLGGASAPLDRAVTENGYTHVLLQEDTLETLGAFQIPGETLDETILRAVRE